MNVLAPRAAGTEDTTPADMVARAAALTDDVRERAAECESGRRLPDATARDFEAAGLARIWIPKRFGGYEFDLQTGLDMLFEVARGCASSSWCLTVYQQHSWIVALYPEEAQQETLGAEPDFHIAAVLSARGTVSAVEGGYLLNGFWPFASGCDHGTWIALGAQLVGADGAPVPLGHTVHGVEGVNIRLCLVPMGEVVNKGDWHVAGLAGTGSHSIVAKDIFVPAHRALNVPDAIEGRAPGRAVNGGALFKAPYYPFLNTALAGPAPGIAQGMLDHFLSRADGRTVMPLNMNQADMVRTHRQVGDAMGRIRAARLLLKDNAERIMAAAETGGEMAAEERIACRMGNALAVDHSYRAAEILFFASGGSSLSLSSPIQRALRDLLAVKSHYFMDLEGLQELAGMVALGRKPYTYIF
jgi:3-hydroxy-9,10-secoandrosta-1,3,5(10)-triene-9,17-dione monooxygenase